jgi:hypothetical protein
VNELVFRGRDRYRASWPVVSVVVLVLIGIGVFRARQLGVEGLSILVGGSIVALALSLVAAFRSWTRVGPEGITTCWGVGRRGHTYPWREIRWVDVKEYNGSSYAARITVANGRRRSLPALRHTAVYPQPTFHADFQLLLQWWYRSTDPSTRFLPPMSRLLRWTPVISGFVLILLVALTLLLVYGVPR